MFSFWGLTFFDDLKKACMTLDTSTFSPKALAKFSVISPSKGGYPGRQRWLIALIVGLLTVLRDVAQTFMGWLNSHTHAFISFPKSMPKSLLSVYSGYRQHALPRLWLMGFVLLLYALNGTQSYGQCPSGWQSYKTVGNAVG
jgi:hypothetical protein